MELMPGLLIDGRLRQWATVGIELGLKKAYTNLKLIVLKTLNEEIQNILNRQQLRLQFRNIRDTSNPFELPNEKFIKLFRLNKQATLELIENLEMFVDNNATRRDAVPFNLQVLVSLIFYAHGGYQTTVGNDFNLGMSQPAVSRIINKISNLITTHLLPTYITFPINVDQVGRVIEGYIFDSNLTILNVNARYPGAVHDAAIWEGSTIHRHLKRKYQEGTSNNYLLGDSGYPLQPWLMTPLPDALPNTPEAVYNERHIRTRNVAERGFGVWKVRFRCLRKDRVLHYSHAAAARIIYACGVLHNICMQHNMQDDLNYDNGDEDNNIDDGRNRNIRNEGISMSCRRKINKAANC
ncbi:hypothetical protein NQ315_015412 [Exocentrus adspersus]|uniref:DDE Tnp4 domain-containing protein n=1 Tax=Exocentrus adspersus TaxID=1586481 RepID=A0AAV8V5Q6_9CUCU|nr:hypothetical protein NQ315_015412 [Exocentrus adspersus]